jgi:hypothetical protein
VLQCLCLGISCGFTTAKTFSLWQVEQAEVSGTTPKNTTSRIVKKDIKKIYYENTEGEN